MPVRTVKSRKSQPGAAHQNAGFSDGRSQPPLTGAPAPAKVVLPPYVPVTPLRRVRTRVGPGGRVVIPAAFRVAAGMEEGAEVTLSLHGKEVRLITPDAALDRARELVMKRIPPGRLLVDELIAERSEGERQETADGH